MYNFDQNKMIFHEVSIFLSNDKNLENSDIQKELKIKSLSNNVINQNVEFSICNSSRGFGVICNCGI